MSRGSLRGLSLVITVMLCGATAIAIGCNKESGAGPAASISSSASVVRPAASEIIGRAIEVRADDKGFTPANIELKKDEKATLIFTRTSNGTCATEVVFPEINVKKVLPLNVSVALVLPTDSARTLNFQCGMGMYKSKVVVQ